MDDDATNTSSDQPVARDQNLVTTDPDEPATGEVEQSVAPKPVHMLRFDAHNPRLVEDLAGPGLSQETAAERLLDDHDPISIARSLARFGFFPSDPVIARELDGTLEVLEGNRRLLAVRLLTDADMRTRLDTDPEYESLATAAASRGIDLTTIPVHVVEKREDANAVIGFRHIVGIKRWPAHEKAAFVSRLLEQVISEGSATPFADVAVLTGEDENDVKRAVRNYRTLTQAAESGVDVSRAREQFGALTYALSVGSIARYIGLSAPSAVAATPGPVFSGNPESVQTLLGLLFGDDENSAAVTDSRRYGDLGKVLASPEARARVLETRQLTDALQFTDVPRDRILKEIRRANTAIKNASAEYADGNLVVDMTTWEELTGLSNALDELVAAIGSPSTAAPPAAGLDDEGGDIEAEETDDEDGTDAYAL